MSPEEVLADLEAAGTEQGRKIYRRHGVTGPVFGVSYAHLNTLAKRIKIDHELALALWATGVHDARELAVKIIDGPKVSKTLLRSWVREVECYVTAGSVAGVAAASRHARSSSDELRDRKDEWQASVGWAIVAFTAEDPSVWTAADLRSLLGQIETEIHHRPNRVRHEMNQALIVIALRDGNLRRQAIAAARRIGRVQVDHGETGCKTPEAIGYIERTVAHRERRATKTAARAG